MIKLLKIESSPVVTRYLNNGYWILERPLEIDLHTNEGILKYRMDKGWITDYRSGSSAVDIVVPKIGNWKYTAVVLCHDMGYSGWVSKDVADELLYQGMVMSGISKIRAGMAYYAVKIAGNGAYYNMDMELKPPYQYNREKEKFSWSDK